MGLLQAPAPPPPPLPPGVFVEPPWATLSSQQIMVISIVAIVAATLILWPLIRAIARRLEGGGRETAEVGALRAELDELRTHVGELDGAVGRVAELEERVDFAERLLAQQREPMRIDAGRPE